MKTPSKPKLPPIALPPTEAELEASLAGVKEEETEKLRRRKGYLSTILSNAIKREKLGA